MTQVIITFEDEDGLSFFDDVKTRVGWSKFKPKNLTIIFKEEIK